MKLRLPHPFVLLLCGVVVAAVLTWVLPAGEYERRADPTNGRSVVVPGTFATVEPAPVGVMGTLVAVPRGIIAGADVIVTILFVGGAFALLESTGALGRVLGALVGESRRPRRTVIIVSVVFAAFGAMENMHEEIIAMVPVLVLLSRGLGFGAVTALAMSLGAACVGAAFGPTNPFGAGLAMKFAELPPLSQGGLRFALLFVAVAVWIAWTLSQTSADDMRDGVAAEATQPPTVRDGLSIAMVVVPILVYVWGVLKLGWEFNELSALFLIAGFGVGLIQRYSIGDTTRGFLAGMDSMLSASLFVGVARAISVVLSDGRVMDTIVAGLVAPLEHVPSVVAAFLMVPVQALIHIPVTSNSGHAVLTMPIMAPLADLLGFSRDAAVMAYQTGAVTLDVMSPTNGAMLAMLLKAGVPYGRWVRFAFPGLMLLWVVGGVGIFLMR